MADSLPPDLVDLQRAYEAAHQRTVDYVAARSAEAGAPWAAADDEELERLRAEREAARKALWAHPAHAGIQASGRWPELKKAAEAPGWGPKG
jgi:hypothetical protein